MARRGENIYKRKDGRWEGRYKSGFRTDGKAKYVSVYGRSYAEVRAVLSEKRVQAYSGTVRCNCCFGEIVNSWLCSVKNKVKESTYINYYIKLQKHILPAFGGVRYEKLTVKSLNDFISDKLNSGLSVKYVSDIVVLIKSVTKFAHRNFNYADKAESVTVPKDKHFREKPVLDEKQQKALTAHLLNCPTSSNVGILLSMFTGIRIGELCSLKWSDIDLEKNILTVSKTMQRIKDISGNTKTKILIDSPKSKSSARTIPLPDFLTDILRKLRSNADDYVLTGKKLYAEPRTMQYRFSAILKKLGLPKVNFHALRHAFATNCIALGFDVKTLSEILGHSSVEITLNRYVHSSMDRKRACMEVLNRQFSCQ